MSRDWSCDFECDRTLLGKYYLLQFYYHLKTVVYPLRGRTNLFVSNKIKLPQIPK